MISLIVVGFYALGVGFSDPSKAFAPTIKIKVVHTHQVTVGHGHHHDFENDGGHEDSHSSGHTHNEAEQKHSAPHSHDVSISMVNGYIFNSGAIAPVLRFVETQDLILSSYSELAPKVISLSSIFRPPIA